MLTSMWTRWGAYLWLLALGTIVAACGSDSTVITPFGQASSGGQNVPGTSATESQISASMGGTDSGGSGTDASSGGSQGGQGDPCTEDDQCLGACWDPKDTGSGTCVDPCTDSFMCPEDHFCDEVVVDKMPVMLCVPIPATMCNACKTSAECGANRDLCVDFNGAGYCTINCEGNPNICPPGFGCGLIAEIGDGKPLLQCVPNNGICCLDEDGDIYGEGDGCLDVDCDDQNAAVHTSAEEVCDGFDNDCNDIVDDMVTDCLPAMCSLGALGYFEQGVESCVEAECVGDPSELCDLYTCSEGGKAGDICADLCDGEDDLKCVPPAHCDDSMCEDDYADGLACDEVSDCESGHCQNDFCCAFGDCCQMAMDCPTFGTQDPICVSPDTCQGTRGEAVCGPNFICANTGIEADDSACTVLTQADGCGFYVAVMCTGAVDQPVPECATTCVSNLDCDGNAYCDPVSNECVPDETGGIECADASWCQSGYCGNGFCCAGGDCCAAETDCPDSYSSDPICVSEATCQGEHDIATCNANSCGTAMGVADDTACVAGTVASVCGPYPDAVCIGGAVQNPPECASTCTADAECDANAYCNDASVCVPDEPDGQTCNDDAECIGDHCQNGFCCVSGDCCANGGDCNAYDEVAACVTEATCQGTRVDGACNPASQCVASIVDDDSGCGGVIANDCGFYPSVSCGAGQNQLAPACPNNCAGDAECDAAAHCSGGMCIADEGPGGACMLTSECESGLSCVDGVCCSSACNGACEACDVAGSEGACTLVPGGQDPDNECGAISCGDYLHSWSGDNCRERADVPSNQASCDGGGACQSAAALCPAQPVGNVVETCDALCQQPDLGTCSGQIDPLCTDVNPGSNTCGLGVCENSMAMCQNGAPLACVPNGAAAGAEMCNNLDNNCDGTVDNGNFSDAFEPNNSCAALSVLQTVGTDGSQSYNSMTVYGQGDDDYYRFRASETDNSCECCDAWCTDEDYRVQVTLTVPPGGGSYQLCTGFGCAMGCSVVLAGGSLTRELFYAGGCPGDDQQDIYVRVYGEGAPAFECLPYTLTYSMTQWCI